MIKNKKILFLHGIFTNKDSCKPLENFCLENNIEFYSFDFSLHGEHEEVKGLVDFEDITNEAITFIAKNDLYGCTIVGHSMGGGVLLNLVNILGPNYFEKAILIDPINLGAKQKNKVTKDISKENIIRAKKWIHEKRKEIDTINKIQGIKLLKLLVNIISDDSLEIVDMGIKKIKTDAILILGGDDKIVDAKNTSKYFKKTNPKIKTHIIKGADHSPHNSKTKEFLKIINNFI